MPYKRKYRPRRRIQRVKRTARPTVAPTVKRYVKSQISRRDPNREFYADPFPGIAVTTTANLVNVSQINQVAGGTQDDPQRYRTQDDLRPLRLDLRGAWSNGASTADGFCRFIAIQWHESSTTPTFGDLVSPNGWWGLPYLAPLKASIDVHSKFTVLHDTLLHLTPASATSGAFQNREIIKSLYLGKKCRRIHYEQPTGTTATMSNGIWVIVVGNALAGANQSFMTLQTRLEYEQV